MNENTIYKGQFMKTVLFIFVILQTHLALADQHFLCQSAIHEYDHNSRDIIEVTLSTPNQGTLSAASYFITTKKKIPFTSSSISIKNKSSQGYSVYTGIDLNAYSAVFAIPTSVIGSSGTASFHGHFVTRQTDGPGVIDESIECVTRVR